MRRIASKTLEKKKKRWQKELKLDAWDIKIKFVSAFELGDHNTAGQIAYCYPNEKSAYIQIVNNYYRYEGYNESWNIDTLIIHELIHVMLHDKGENMPKVIKESTKFYNYEEFICDSFAKIIYDCHKNKSKKL